MKLIKNYADNYGADDESGIWFGTNTPTSVPAYHIGHCGVVRPETKEIQLEDLEFVRAVNSEHRNRPDGRPGWTSNIIHSLYLLKREFGHKEVVLASSVSTRGFRGLGPAFYVWDQLEVHKTFVELFKTLDNHVAWDIVEGIIGSYNKGKDEGVKRTQETIYTAFVEGRLKKRKQPRSDKHKVWIENRKVPA